MKTEHPTDNIQHSILEYPNTLTLHTYLTVQLQQILDCGEAHVLTYAPKTDWSNWLQISVHGGSQWHLTVQFPIPDSIAPKQFDRLFRSFGWSHWQADRFEIRVYYLGRCATHTQLFAQAEAMAQQIARAMELLWNVRSAQDIALLGARGPALALVRQTEPQEAVLPLAA